MEGYFIEAKYGWVCVHFNNENKYTQKTIDKSFFFFFLNIMQKYQRKNSSQIMDKSIQHISSF